MLLVFEEVKDDVERGTVEVVERNLCLYLRHFLGFSDRPRYLGLNHESLIEARRLSHEAGHDIAGVLSTDAA